MKRKFRIFAGRYPGEWRWECSLCDPIATGGRKGPFAWQKIVTISMRGHMMRRRGHHAYVKRYR
jgi:hypothetical protein